MWKDILKLKISNLAKLYIEEIMSNGDEWTTQEIMDEIPERIKIRPSNAKRYSVGSQTIPTRRELEAYLRKKGYIKRTEKRAHPLALGFSKKDRGNKVTVQIWRKE
jgi:hypothetical protein